MKNKSRFEQLYLSLNKSSTIILVGFMGSGKTTFGKELAKKLNYQFLDTDKEIEQLMGISIADLFETKGEAYFRTLERQLIENMSVKKMVIATGGGLPCFLGNMDLLNQKGVTVYLKYSSQELFERLKNDKLSRPLLSNKSDTSLLEYIQKLLIEREGYYLKAQTIF